jgi:sortase B
MIGWLTVDGTTIDYPVMQSPDYPDYYLVRDFFKKPSTYGCPYVQSNCNLKKPSDNIIIYSHYMKDGTMFAELEKYKDSDFYKEHKTITFEIDGKMNYYEVMAVIDQAFTTEDDKTFKFNQFVNAFDPHSFNQFVSQAKSLSLFDTDIDAQPGDKLLTLATSEHNENGERFIIVAKRK